MLYCQRRPSAGNSDRAMQPAHTAPLAPTTKLTAAFSAASCSRCRRSCSATQRLRSFSSRRFSACREL